MDSRRLFEILGFKRPYYSTVITSPNLVSNFCGMGIEIETEETNPKSIMLTTAKYLSNNQNYWSFKEDGSLRGNSRWEYVLSKPLRGKELLTHINCLQSAFDKHGVNHSYRTSIHVHVDVRMFVIQQLINLVFFTLIFEPLLAKYFSEDRKLSNFCVYRGHTNMEELALHLYRILYTQDQDYRNSLSRSVTHQKYTGINFSSLVKFGSVEYRQLQGTNDLTLITQWINILQRLWLVSKQYTKTLPLTLRAISQSGYKKMLL